MMYTPPPPPSSPTSPTGIVRGRCHDRKLIIDWMVPGYVSSGFYLLYSLIIFKVCTRGATRARARGREGHASEGERLGRSGGREDLLPRLVAFCLQRYADRLEDGTDSRLSGRTPFHLLSGCFSFAKPPSLTSIFRGFPAMSYEGLHVPSIPHSRNRA